MRVSTFLPSEGGARCRIVLEEDEWKHLRQGTVNPRIIYEGDVVHGLHLRVAEDKGIAIKEGNSIRYASFEVAARKINAKKDRHKVINITTIKSRGDNGPILVTDRFPDGFIDPELRRARRRNDDEVAPQFARAEAENLFKQPLNGRDFKEIEEKLTVEQADEEPVEIARDDLPEVEQAPVQTVEAEVPTGNLTDIKDCINMLNDLMAESSDEVVLQVVDNRIVAKRRVVVLQDL